MIIIENTYLVEELFNLFKTQGNIKIRVYYKEKFNKILFYDYQLLEEDLLIGSNRVLSILECLNFLEEIHEQNTNGDSTFL